MKLLKRIIPLIFILTGLLSLSFTSSNVTRVNADTGPKPYTEITIRNLEKSDYIVSYASKTESYYGPHHVFIPGDEQFGETYYGSKEDLTLLYNNVSLPENWHLLDISDFYEDSTDLLIESGYYWPKEFILIIYNKVKNNYYLTEETHTYAFHSYFEFDMSNYSGKPLTLGIQAKDITDDDKITLSQNYDYSKEILGFFIRLAFTLIVEMILALLFRFNKKSLLIIGITNVATQIGLNIGLNLVAHFMGKTLNYLGVYILIELAVVIIEAIIYRKFCERGEDETNKLTILYAIIANIVSFALGMLLWLLWL